MEIMELTTVLGTLLGTLTPLGGVGVWLYRKQNKRLKEAEAQLAETNVSKAKIEGKADEWHIWKEQCEALSDQNKALIERNEKLVQMNADKEDRHQADIKDWEERFTNQTTYLRGVQRDLIAANEREKDHLRKEGQLEKRLAVALNWICKKANCDHGEPPRERLKGRKYEDDAHSVSLPTAPEAPEANQEYEGK